MITLICGLPNAGKTTFSNRFDNVIHRDECDGLNRIEFERKVAETEGDVYADAVCNSRQSRAGFLDSVRHRTDKKVCIWIDTPLEVCIERENAYRKRPTSMVIEHARRFEPPTLDEGWDEIIRITAYECNSIKKQT